jgi:parvulin-like peptidyl-prolyl isomerase
MTIPLVTVNGRSVSIAEALQRSIVHNENFLDNTIDYALLRDHAGRHGISNSDEELQLAADELRYQRGLETVEKVNQWMRANHQTLLSLQEAIDGMLLRNKIRNSIPEAEVAAYYAEHQLELESVELYSIRVDSDDKARELLAQINEQGAGFQQLAVEHSLDSETKKNGGYAGKLTRGQMTGPIEAVVFKARVGQVVGPLKTDLGYNLFKVAAIHKPTLAESAENVRMTLFKNLLSRLRSEAEISYPVLEGAAMAPAV